MTYRPQFYGTVFEGYARKWSAKNHWRVRYVLDDPEDVVQECAYVWCKIEPMYRDVEGMNDQWFMALFKRALANYFTSLARINKRRAAALDAAREVQDMTPAEEGHLHTTLVHASRELREVLRVIAIAPRDLLDLLLPTPQYRFSAAAERRISRSWCRLALRDGLTVREDLVTELRMLLA